MANTIYHNLLIEASPEKVFEAISSPEHLINWWPLTCKGMPELGSTYNLHFGPEYDWYGEVIEYKFPQSFHIKMTKSDKDWEPTSFGFYLEPKNRAVYLRFQHAGWPQSNDHFKHSSFCWALLLNGLKDYVEKGRIIPFEERS